MNKPDLPNPLRDRNPQQIGDVLLRVVRDIAKKMAEREQ